MQKRPLQSGMALIEIIVIMILLAIVITVTAPHFEQNSAQAKIRDILRYSEGITSIVGSYYDEHRVLPKNNADAGLPSSDEITAPNIQFVLWNAGLIVIQPKNTGIDALDAANILLSPTETNDGLGWRCDITDDTLRTYLPAECRQ